MGLLIFVIVWGWMYGLLAWFMHPVEYLLWLVWLPYLAIVWSEWE